MLQYCLSLVERGKAEDFTGYLVKFRDEWMLNDTVGPIGEVLSTRLLGRQIVRNTVSETQIRWHADGETLVYNGIQLTMQNVRDLIAHELNMAMTVFNRDLCFDLENMPQYPVEKIVDNWDARSPRASFITDVEIK